MFANLTNGETAWPIKLARYPAFRPVSLLLPAAI